MVSKPETFTDEAVADLINRHRNGDHQAFKILGEACSRPVWLYIRSRVPNPDAEDLFQKYQTALAEYLRRPERPIRNMNHLQRLALKNGKCRVAEFYRRKERKQKHRGTLPKQEPPDPGENPEQRLIRVEQKAAIPTLVHRLLLETNLTDAQLDAVVFVYLLEQKKRKVAADLGICEKALRERLEGAFKKFRNYVEKEMKP